MSTKYHTEPGVLESLVDKVKNELLPDYENKGKHGWVGKRVLQNAIVAAEDALRRNDKMDIWAMIENLREIIETA